MFVIKESNPTQSNQRNFTNKPELRFENILEQLNNKILTIEELKAINVHSDIMIDFLANCYESYSLYKQLNPSDSTFGNLTDGIVPYNISHV